MLITATIAVPASTGAAIVQSSLSTSLGTAAAASAQLGIAIEEVPAAVAIVVLSVVGRVFTVVGSGVGGSGEWVG